MKKRTQNYIPTYDERSFTDDFLFCKILENNTDITKDLIELILGLKVRQVIVKKQEAIEITSDGRGIRLDEYAEDENDTKKVFLNAASKSKNISENLKDFLHLLTQGTGNSELSRKIEKQVEQSRKHEEWRVQYMTLAMREEGRGEGRNDLVRQMLRTGKTAEKIATFCNLELADVVKIQETLL